MLATVTGIGSGDCGRNRIARANGNRFDGFAVRDSVAPQVPGRAILPDVAGGPALIAAVVPFVEVGVDSGVFKTG